MILSIPSLPRDGLEAAGGHELHRHGGKPEGGGGGGQARAAAFSQLSKGATARPSVSGGPRCKGNVEKGEEPPPASASADGALPRPCVLVFQ